MRIKTSELTGAALDWVVILTRCMQTTDGKPILSRDLANAAVRNGMASPSTDLAEGGPIMNAAEIDTYMVERGSPLGWVAEITGTRFRGRGNTRLIAAMRCFVASWFGNEVDVPDSLVCASVGTQPA